MDANIAKLKVLLLKNIDFKETTDYFFHHFIENKDSLEQSRIINDKPDFYYELLRPIFKTHNVYLDKRKLSLRRIEKYHLTECLAWLLGGEALFFYFFKDIQLGIGVISSVKTSINCFFQVTSARSESVFMNPGHCSDHHKIN